MLLEFSVSNFRSIRDKQTFSLLSSERIKENPDTIIKFLNYNIISSSIIYGRNASGKSNLIKALSALQLLVINSGNYKDQDRLEQYDPYILDNEYSTKPVEFSIEFIAKDSIRYIFEVNISENSIIKENLYFFPKGQKAKLYERSLGQNISYGEYLKGPKKDIEDLLYANQLYISKIKSERLEVLQPALKFFTEYLLTSLFDDNEDATYIEHIKKQFLNSKRPKFKENLKNLLKFADTGIYSIESKMVDVEKYVFPENMPLSLVERIKADLKFKINTMHHLFDGSEKIGEIALDLQDESLGTQKLFGLGGCIIEALMDGQVLILDEFDKSLHPNLSKALIKLFNSKKTNPFNAQLIVATHDVSLLDNNLFRRDQVWFAEKEYEGYSHYYSLSDIKGVRADTPFEQWYLKGKFGATPVLDELTLDFDF